MTTLKHLTRDRTLTTGAFAIVDMVPKEKAEALQEMKDYDIYIWPKKNPPAGQPGKSFPDYYEESL